MLLQPGPSVANFQLGQAGVRGHLDRGGNFFGDMVFVFEGDCTCYFRKRDGMKCVCDLPPAGDDAAPAGAKRGGFHSERQRLGTVPSTGELLICSFLICVRLHLAEMLQI